MGHAPLTHVVLGASGSAGNAITHALCEEGHTVVAVNRGGDADVPSGVERRAADVASQSGANAAVAGASVVYMAAQPSYFEWQETFPSMLAHVIDATAAANAKLVMVDNAYGYGPGSSPMTEETAEQATDTKGATRREMTRMLVAAHESGRLPVAIGRASDYFGPRGNNSAITTLGIQPVAKPSGAIKWIGSLDQPHSVAFLPDIARAYVTLGTDDLADGQIWHLPHGEPITGRAFLTTVNAQLPEPRPIGVITPLMLRLASPFHKISRETLGILYQWTEPFVLDSRKFEKVFGTCTPTPLDVALEETVASHRSIASSYPRT